MTKQLQVSLKQVLYNDKDKKYEEDDSNEYDDKNEDCGKKWERKWQQ